MVVEQASQCREPSSTSAVPYGQGHYTPLYPAVEHRAPIYPLEQWTLGVGLSRFPALRLEHNAPR